MGPLLLLGDPQQVFPGVLTSLRGFFGVRVCGQCWSVGQCLLGRGVLTQFWGSNHPVLVLVAVSFPKETNPLVGIPTHPGLAFLRFWICPEKKFPVEGKVPFPLFFLPGCVSDHGHLSIFQVQTDREQVKYHPRSGEIPLI